MRTAAILPVKRFLRAKQRLGATVADRLRLELASAMVADVMLALARVPSIERTIVVTCEQSLHPAVSAAGALLVEDHDESSQSAAVTLGVQRALAEDFERVLCVPGDCPSLDPAELRALLAEQANQDSAQVVVVPDRHGTGTNGLLLAPPDAIEPAFGPGSCERHLALARAAGVSWQIARPSSLLLDIDTGEDLAALRERLSGRDDTAARTRAVLGMRPAPSLSAPA